MLRYLIVLISFIVFMSSSTYASRLALVIGNNDYIYESPLNSPVNDAKDMAKVLRGLGFTVIAKYNLKQRDFDQVVQAFEDQLHKYNVGLFYYSGHGLQAQGENYLVPIDARIKSAVDIKYKSINANQILEKMEYANKHTNLLILDACRDNPFKSIRKGFSQGLAEMSPRGSLIAFATSPGTASLDGLPSERNSIYTKHLLNQLRTQPHLSVSDLLTQVAGGVARETKQEQWPWKSDSLTSMFYFAQSSTPPPPASFEPGNVFRDRLQDGSSGPKMVVIPAGRFRMGDIQGGGSSDEKPVHRVSIKQFAMGKYEVTVGEFQRFVNATAYKTEAEKGDGCYVYDDSWGKKKEANWRNPYFSQNDNHPVVCVSWNDAVAYAEWLSQQTGKQYRLPTEAEWEYATRAKTTTSRYWGNNPDDACRYANVHDKTSKKENGFSWIHHNCTDGYAKTAPIGSFKSNDFGLLDMLGNVWEWTCSEYENEYSGKEKQCISKNRARQPVIRGGSWNCKPRGVRAAYRDGYSHDYRFYFVGFRLAR